MVLSDLSKITGKIMLNSNAQNSGYGNQLYQAMGIPQKPQNQQINPALFQMFGNQPWFQIYLAQVQQQQAAQQAQYQQQLQQYQQQNPQINNNIQPINRPIGKVPTMTAQQLQLNMKGTGSGNLGLGGGINNSGGQLGNKNDLNNKPLARPTTIINNYNQKPFKTPDISGAMGSFSGGGVNGSTGQIGRPDWNVKPLKNKLTSTLAGVWR